MTRALLLVLLVVAVAPTFSCARQTMFQDQRPLRRGVIEIYRDFDGTCKTNTTPYFRVNKKNQRQLQWRIVDDNTGCLDAADATVEIKFDKGDADLLPSCIKRNKNKIECSTNSALVGRSAYNVYLGTSKEDPVLEIEEI